MLRYLLFLLCCASAPQYFAQYYQGNGCTDSTKVVSGYLCVADPADYFPVCGCDNETYFNECFATANGLLSYQSGPCEIFDFNFNPNPGYDNVSIQFFTRELTDIQIWIFDLFFRQKYYFRYPYVYPGSKFEGEVLDVRGFGNGLHFIVVESQGFYKVKRLLVNQLN